MASPPPETHKLLVSHLRECVSGEWSVVAYGDNQGRRRTLVGAFGSGKKRFYSTVGVFEKHLPVPWGSFELAAFGSQTWLPNSLASSLYWLEGRSIDAWPLVCEDVIRHNAASRYRHIAYVPSGHRLEVAPGRSMQWLLGVPLSDKEIGLTNEDAGARAAKIYPDWLVTSDA